MLDRFLTPLSHKLLNPAVQILNKKNIHPDKVTFMGFLVGMLVIPFLYFNWWAAAFFAIAFNRICDGIDGELARLQGTQSDAGGYLDICLDFLFYSAVPFGFVIADPMQNGIAGTALIFAFIGTGISFLAFAIMAEKHKLARIQFNNKSFHYLNGLTEGTETIMFFVLFCVFPQYFSHIAWVFVLACTITIFTRIHGGYNTLRQLND